MLPVYILIFIILMGVVGMVGADENYVTVYNENLALVKQIRLMDVSPKNLPLRFTDVAAKLIPTSVHLRSLSGNKAFQVVEQNFEYDLVSADKILEKYIDHQVEIVTESGELINGALLSKSGNLFVIKTEDGIKILPWNDKMAVNVKDLPEGLITRPTLIWEVVGVKEGQEKLEVSYLTEGLSWHAEYVGVLNEKSTRINLDAWVSLDNHCGTTYKDAHLKLVAGEVHRAPSREIVRRMAKGVMEAPMDMTVPTFEEREFFEYHIYELDRPTTIKDNQIKQISLFPPAEVSCQKKFYYNAGKSPKKVEVKVLFKNDKNAGLGIPLPEGIFRIYQKDQESLEFIGEDRISHTSRNEEVKITVGKAFDLVGERRVVDRRKISQRSERQTIEIELRNNKEKEDVVIIVEENLYYYDWRIEDNNFPYRKVDAYHVEFDIPVKANSKQTLQYTVVYSW
ncbi:MAG: DUF4139 domain-containing protein [Calditrichia bacterium]